MPTSRYIWGMIPWYSVLIVSGALIAIVLAVREEKNIGLKKDTVLDLSLWILPIGIIGARIYYVVFSWNEFRGDLLSVLRVWEGGIAIYGALIAGLITILVFSRARKIAPLVLCDIAAPGVVLAQAIGRWGNFFNMEAYGVPVTDRALQFFPFAVLIPSDSAAPWHMATFFYESLWDLLVFVCLLIARRRLFRRTGDVFFSYAFLYACGRLVVEDFRMDSLYAASSVRVSQLLSVIICAALLILFFLRSGRSILQICFFAISMLMAVFVLGYCLNIVIHPSAMSMTQRFVSLSSFSVLYVLSFFLLYGRSEQREVIYAIHKN